MITLNKINDNALSVTIGPRTWFFSYQTCVAYQDARPVSEGGSTMHGMRRQSNYSVTTAKHMNYMGVSEWPKVDDATFERLAGGGSG